MTAQAEFEDLLKRTMGLDAVSIGSTAVERAVRIRMANAGLTQTEDYLRRLRDSNEELQELIEAVVVPETWFFRDPQAFVVLVRLLTEEWRSASPSTLLRLLSVPCSTGEEPYSIVMSLVDGGFSPNQIQVDAIDISARVLAWAKRAIYGSNSFRGDNLTFRDRYFQPVGNSYKLTEGIRSHVSFLQRNLLSLDSGVSDQLYDVIFCRNVLIYFDRPTQEQVMRSLRRLLRPTGLLFVGPAEAFLASGSGFMSVNHTLSFAFRKCDAKPTAPILPPQAPRIPAKKEHPRAVATLPPPPISPRPVLQVVEAVDLGAARKMADSGRLNEAAALCESQIAARGPSADAYSLLGLIRDASGDRRAAASCYQRAIYLEPEHVEALIHLALVKDAEGDSGGAGRLRERARRAGSKVEEGSP